MLRTRILLAAALVASTLVLADCGPKPIAGAAGRGVLVLAIDGLRADHLSALGYDRPTTPRIDVLAKQGAIFADAWSCSPEVLPAHAGILTGCDPRLALRPEGGRAQPASELSNWSVPDRLPRLAQAFLSHGFETAAFVDHPSVSEIRGLARGFQRFHGFREDAAVAEYEQGFEGVATKFKSWTTSLALAADWFAYLEVDDLERMWTRPFKDPSFETLFPPRPELAEIPPIAEADHAYFAVPRTRWGRAARSLGEYESRYDGALRFLDKLVGRLLVDLKRQGRLDTTTVVIVGTFGTSFGESGLVLDTGSLTEADLRVPIVIRPAKNLDVQRGLHVAELASTIDLAPTLLGLLGIAAPRGMQGTSYAGLFRGQADPPRTIAFASGGFQKGLAAIDARCVLSETRPASARGALRTSWFGEEVAMSDATRLHLVDRVADRSKGDLGPDADLPDERARLESALREWYGWIDRARPILHGRASPSSDPAMERELAQRGLANGGS